MGTAGPSASRRRLFVVATALVPPAFFVVVELALRLLGIGGAYPLFVDAPGMPGFRQASPDVIQRYATGAVQVSAAIEPIPFLAEKPPDVYRIVVQGGSTAAGFPYGRWAGLAGMLGDRLEADLPEKKIEVITTAMAAVNSYTLLDLVDEIIEIEPDAVLVYAGHNEYLGVLGVGSALSARSSREATLLYLKLRRLRVYQVIHAAVTSLRTAIQGGGAADRASLFARAAAGSLIDYGSPAYQRGVAQLEANLDEILRRYQEAGIPVYVATLVSNEKDQPPFAGGPAADVDPEVWGRTWQAFERADAGGDVEAQRAELSRLLELDPDAGDVWFALARVEEEAGRPREARDAYRAARDRDRLRFRAPSVFNERIRALARRHDATLVEVEERFADASPDGIPGHELLLEHVHPNDQGYFLLADVFRDALARDGRIGDWSNAPSEEEARREMPITAIDRVLAKWDVQELTSSFPFRHDPVAFVLPEPQNEVEVLARQLRAGEIDWLHAMEGLLQIRMREGRTEEAATVARMVAQAYPTAVAPNRAAGLLLMELHRPARALRYLRRSLRVQPDDPQTLEALVRASVASGDPRAAHDYLEELGRVAPRNPLVIRSRAGRP